MSILFSELQRSIEDYFSYTNLDGLDKKRTIRNG